MDKVQKEKAPQGQTTENQTPKEKIQTMLDDIPHRTVIFRALRMWRNKEFIKKIDHAEIVSLVIDDGRMTSRYSFMVTMSCAIAILGLLLSSPAVVIGAMLISPLMGPIVSLGFSLCILDIKQLRKSLEAIGIGLLLALLVSILIVIISPLTDPTAEILARTRPNLFDLLVAVFSGLAGGYAVIKNRGGAIVGVAIATALMPPLAVTGYGIATASASIAFGALFLFMTNLLAIALSVSALAKWYGFGAHNGPKHTLYHSATIIAAFIILSIPLGISLHNIAWQSYASKTIRSEIETYFNFANSRISNYQVAFKRGGAISVDTILITDSYAPTASEEISENIETALKKPVYLALNQIIMAKSEQKKIEENLAATEETALTSPLQSKLVSAGQGTEEITNAIKNALFFPVHFIKVNPENNTITIYPKKSHNVDIAMLRQIEQNIQSRYPSWNIFIIPPYKALPAIYFQTGKNTANAAEQDKINDIIWALTRWDIKDIAVIGFASTIGEFERFNNDSLAFQRAQYVVDKLKSENINALAKAEYKSYNQINNERNEGALSFQRVEIRLITTDETIKTMQRTEEEKAEELLITPKTLESLDQRAAISTSEDNNNPEDITPPEEKTQAPSFNLNE